MADDELYYLQPGYDVSSLTIPRLRSILVAHDINYPSSAKKSDLINLVQSHIIPQSKKLLSAQARIRRTSKGIENIPSSQEDESELMPPPPAPPKTPRSRKSKSNLQNEDDAPRTGRASRTPSTRRSVRKPRESDTETEDRPLQSARRVRKSSPGVKIEASSVPSRRSLAAGESPFSDDNPFQSGSSPPAAPRTVSKSRKSDVRQSTGKKRSPVVIKSETYELPVSSLGVDRAGVETTEEFTVDEGRDLQQELAKNKQLARVRNTALVRKKPTSTTTKSIPFVVLVAVLGAIGGWYREEKINIGYCGVGEPNWSLSQNPNIPAWAHEHLQPQCEPCPSHAICYPRMEVRCEDDFVLRQHPLSCNGLVPLPPTCEPDSEKERRIKAVADRAVDELRECRAAYECGDRVLSTETETEIRSHGTTAETKLEISEETLKKAVSKMRRKGMSEEEFDDLWRGALGNVLQRDEVEVIRDGSRLLLSSKSLARLPLICAIRRSLVRTISRSRIPIAILITIIASLAYGRHRFVTYNQAKAQIPSLVSMTLDRLATQAALKEDGRAQESFISVGQLRDDVLRNVISARERERVWERVRKIVEGNSNVRAATREGGKTGEWSRVWEWIGPVNLAPGLEGRRSGLIEVSDTPENHGQEIRTWDEGRPIY